MTWVDQFIFAGQLVLPAETTQLSLRPVYSPAGQLLSGPQPSPHKQHGVAQARRLAGLVSNMPQKSLPGLHVVVRTHRPAWFRAHHLCVEQVLQRSRVQSRTRPSCLVGAVARACHPTSTEHAASVLVRMVRCRYVFPWRCRCNTDQTVWVLGVLLLPLGWLIFARPHGFLVYRLPPPGAPWCHSGPTAQVLGMPNPLGWGIAVSCRPSLHSDRALSAPSWSCGVARDRPCIPRALCALRKRSSFAGPTEQVLAFSTRILLLLLVVVFVSRVVVLAIVALVLINCETGS